MPKVLIIDDEPDLVSALAAYFERAGHEVARALTAQEGIEAFRRSRPDLVLLDVKLPDKSGFDVLSELRDEQPVVIMITGHGDVPLAVRAMKEGAENFLTKPVELEHLGAAADRAFEKARLQIGRASGRARGAMR